MRCVGAPFWQIEVKAGEMVLGDFFIFFTFLRSLLQAGMKRRPWSQIY